MYRLSDNYYHRKCYFERNQVPTSSIIKKKMTEPLANIYFKSMSKDVKVYTDPMPSTKPTEWYMPPEEMLAGRAVLKPIKNQHLRKFTATGLWNLGQKLKEDHYQSMLLEMKKSLKDNDENWKDDTFQFSRKQYASCSKQEAANNTKKLIANIRLFETMYMTSINTLEETIKIAADKEIERIRGETHQHMKLRLKQLLKCQALRMQNEFETKLNKKKAELKKQFIDDVGNIRSDAAKQIHDSNYEKHVAIEKLRHFLQCQNLACQVYVALKEKEACEKELEQSKHLYKKKVKGLQDEIKMKDLEIKLKAELQNKREELNKVWHTKICHVVKNFQLFVVYCLRQLPSHAEFFLNMEKLMLLQLSEACDSPDFKSNISEPERFHTPEPRPHPFYLFCDLGYKPDVDQNLCPRHVTSSASQFPVIVIDRHLIYPACDSYQISIKKVAEYIHGNKGEDIEDNNNYELKVPVKYTSLMQLLELKLESSLMQVIQNELPNSRDLPINCSYCKIPVCYCTEKHICRTSIEPLKNIEKKEESKHTSGQMTIETELQMQREPKWESYSDFVTTRRCKCSKTAQKNLFVHLPPYMKNMSPYVPPELPNYETCDVKTLKKLVNRANKISTKIKKEIVPEKNTKDAFTQYSDNEFKDLCTCLSDDNISEFLQTLMKGVNAFELSDNQKRLQPLDVTTRTSLDSALTRSASSFATARAHSLHHLLHDDPSLKEIFDKSDCD